MGAFGVWRPISVLLVVLLSQAPGVVLPFNVGLKLPLQTRASLSPVLGLREGPRTLGMPLPHRARSSVPVLAGLSAQQRSDESGHRGRRVAAAPQLAGLVIAGFLAGMIGAAPVDAAFGPGAAAVTSAPMVEFDSNKLENIDKMSAKKREQFRKVPSQQPFATVALRRRPARSACLSCARGSENLCAAGFGDMFRPPTCMHLPCSASRAASPPESPTHTATSKRSLWGGAYAWAQPRSDSRAAVCRRSSGRRRSRRSTSCCSS